MKKLTTMLAGLVLVTATAVHAEGLVQAKLLSLDLARTIADAALEACRKEGYQVSVVVSDRSGEPLVVMRDIYSNRYFTQLALGKTNAVVMANTTSAELLKNRPDMVNELNLLDGVMVLAGGVPVQVAGSLVGAVGVSGAPGGDLDRVRDERAPPPAHTLPRARDRCPVGGRLRRTLQLQQKLSVRPQLLGDGTQHVAAVRVEEHRPPRSRGDQHRVHPAGDLQLARIRREEQHAGQRWTRRTGSATGASSSRRTRRCSWSP